MTSVLAPATPPSGGTPVATVPPGTQATVIGGTLAVLAIAVAITTGFAPIAL